VWLSGLGSKKLSGKEQARGENMSCVFALRGCSSFFFHADPMQPTPKSKCTDWWGDVLREARYGVRKAFGDEIKQYII
jgi:hypothetical protein